MREREIPPRLVFRGPSQPKARGGSVGLAYIVLIPVLGLAPRGFRPA